MALMAAVLPLSPQEEEGGVRPTGGSHLSGFSPFPFFRISSSVLHLIEAFRHFPKFWKNSQGLYILWGTCDKICSLFEKYYG